jgi:predicted 3-demethylubiquinone-9 3-methyltransferase (glyoxalase superfamily)
MVKDVRTCLWFDREAEAAAELYVSLIPGSRIETVQRAPDAWPAGEAGDVILIDFRLGETPYQAINGGGRMDYGAAASISVICETQAELDRLWTSLCEDGGSEMMCGWLRDRWGVPWQIAPECLPRFLADPDPEVSRRVFKAMQAMVKLDASGLEAAAAGAAAGG